MGCVPSKTKEDNLELVLEEPDNNMAPINKWQDCNENEDIEDSEHCESAFQSLGEFMLFLMGNEGLKHIADKIFSSSVTWWFSNGQTFTYYVIGMGTLADCRLVSRAFRDYLDNHMSMLHLQIKHFRDFRSLDTEECGAGNVNSLNSPLDDWVNYGLFDYMENEVKDVSKLRTFLGLLRDIASDNSHLLIESPFKYMVNNHMHKELELLMNSPLPIYPEKRWGHWVDDVNEWPSYIFLYACSNGCGECVQPFLDHVGDKFIDVNWTRNHLGKAMHLGKSCMHAAFENDFKKGKGGEYRFKPRVLPLLLYNKSEKGINVNALNWDGKTVKERVTEKYKWDNLHYEDRECEFALGRRDEFDVYEMLDIDPIRDTLENFRRLLTTVKTSDPKSKSNSSSDSSSTSDSESIPDPNIDLNSSSDSSFSSDSESNWETVSDTCTDTDA